MEAKITLLTLLFLGLNIGFAQENQECLTKTSIFHEAVKSKNYDSAYDSWMEVRTKCPDYNIAIYTDGEKILNHKIKNATDADKVAYIDDLAKLWKERKTHFAAKTPAGDYGSKEAQLMYDNKKDLNKTNEEIYNSFDAAYKLDKASFRHPKRLYTYFSVMVDLYDEGKKPAKDLFNKYDDIADKIEEEVKKSSEGLNKLIEKEDAGVTLTSREGQYKRSYESYLKNYAIISKNIDAKLGKRANCENLVPLYQKDFEQNKNDAVWLKRAVSRMYHKECTKDPLYEKLVKAYDQNAPSADTKYFVGTLLFNNGKETEAIGYFKQSYDLETDTFKKSRLANRIGLILKKKGRYSQARDYFRNALKLNPSNGRPHISIAEMYASSANKCGDTTFNKRAVYWLAADEAGKAGRVDPTLKTRSAKYVASYEGKAPSTSDVFSCGCSGQVIKIGCWIGSSVTVPKI